MLHTNDNWLPSLLNSAPTSSKAIAANHIVMVINFSSISVLDAQIIRSEGIFQGAVNGSALALKFRH